jgi:hypothetical protein
VVISERGGEAEYTSLFVLVLVEELGEARISSRISDRLFELGLASVDRLLGLDDTIGSEAAKRGVVSIATDDLALKYA